MPRASPDNFDVGKVESQLSDLNKEQEMLLHDLNRMRSSRGFVVTVQSGYALIESTRRLRVFRDSLHRALEKSLPKQAVAKDPTGPESVSGGPKSRKKAR